MKKILSIVLALAVSTPVQAAGNVLLGRSKANRCAACHGDEGIGVHRRFPDLAGQDEAYLIEQLKAFRNDTRIDPLGLCNPIAKTLSDEDIEDLAAYYSSFPASGDLKERLKRGK